MFDPLTQRPAEKRLEKWKKESVNPDVIKKSLPSGNQLPYQGWKTLNHIRREPQLTNLIKWGIEDILDVTAENYRMPDIC